MDLLDLGVEGLDIALEPGFYLCQIALEYALQVFEVPLGYPR